jgi:hypothetical protein
MKVTDAFRILFRNARKISAKVAWDKLGMLRGSSQKNNLEERKLSRKLQRYQNILLLSRIWGSHGGEYEGGCLLGCSAV